MNDVGIDQLSSTIRYRLKTTRELLRPRALPFWIMGLDAVPELLGQFEALFGRQLQQFTDGFFRNCHASSVPDPDDPALDEFKVSGSLGNAP